MYTMPVSPTTAALSIPGLNQNMPYVSVLTHANMIGTGGNSGIEYWIKRQYQGYKFFLNLAGDTFCLATAIGPETSSVSDTIGRIRDILKLSISDVAASIPVSRQAVYKWLSGESASLDPEHQNRLNDLYKAAELFALNGMIGSAMLLKRKGGNSRTLLETVRTGESAQEWALSMLDTLALEAKQTAMLDERLRARRKPNQAISEWGTPMLSEKNA